MDIKISCDKYLRICGDISKHKFLRLNKTAEKLQVVINNSGGDITLSDAYRTMDYFYEWFHQDFFHLHLTVIAQMINDVAWAIYFYLSPEFTRSYTRDDKKSEKMNAEIYFYTYPADVTTDLGRHFYWDLMNEIRAKPYVQPFVTATYFKEDPDRIITAEND